MIIEASSSVHPIRSRTEGIEGFVDVDVRDDGTIDLDTTITGSVSLDVNRLSSGNPLEDRELKRRIDARRFPTIEGRLVDVRAGADGAYVVRGDVTFRGVTRSHEDEVTFTALEGGELRLQGTTVFDVRDYGLQPPRILMLRVHPDVKVTLDAVAERVDQ